MFQGLGFRCLALGPLGLSVKTDSESARNSNSGCVRSMVRFASVGQRTRVASEADTQSKISRGPSTILYYTILYYTILFHTIVYCTILPYTMQYKTVLYYIILYDTILYYIIVYKTIPHGAGPTWQGASYVAQTTPPAAAPNLGPLDIV